MRFIYCVCLFFLLNSVVYGQIGFSGKVIDEQLSPVPFAMVTVNNPSTNMVLDYGMVEEAGQYIIELKTDLSEVLLTVSAMGYKTEKIRLKAQNQVTDFKLVRESMVLEEVVVKASLITQYNDTIVFDLNAFASEKDRVLEDVIKKMPGLEITEQGGIEYQGKPINKFYVEGKDLMQGNYSMITKAMPNLHVSKLEVVENHQPVKMLEGIEPSDSPAINIRLKRDVSFSGSGKLGVGASPFLWNAALTPMLFSKDLQYLISYDANNIGKDLSNKLYNHSFSSDFEPVVFTPSTSEALTIATTGVPPINTSRYLLNKSHLGSVNFLTNLTETLTFNTNVLYYNDEVESKGVDYTEIAFLDPAMETPTNSTIRFIRRSDASYFDERFKAVFTLEENEKGKYLKDNLTLSMARLKDKGLLLQNTTPISQSLFSPTFTIQNSFSTLIKIGEDKFANLKSLIDFTNDKQGYDVQTNGDLSFQDTTLDKYDLLSQEYLKTTFKTINSLSMSWQFNKWFLTTEYGMDYNSDKLVTDLNGLINTEQESVSGKYHNDLRYSLLKNTINPRLSYKSRLFNFTVNLPVEYNMIQLTDKNGINKDDKNTFTFLPSLNASYQVTKKIKLNTGVSVSKSFTPLDQLYGNYIFSGLNFEGYDGKIEETNLYTPSVRFEYKNTLTSLLFSGGVQYQKKESDVLLGTSIDANGLQVVKAIPLFNTAATTSANFVIGKYFGAITTNIKGGYRYVTTEADVLLNDNLSQVSLVKNQYALEIVNNMFTWLNLEYNLKYQVQERQDNTSNYYTYFTSHNAVIDITPFKGHSFSWKLDYEENVFAYHTFTNRFIDLGYHYNWKAKDIDFYLDWTNVLNTQTYNQVIINTIQTSATMYQLRPSQVLLSVRFNF